MLNTTDKALGGIFGIARGVIILAIFDLIINQCMFNETPKWIENSKLRPAISSISNFMILILPDDLQNKILSHMSQIKKQSLLDFVKEDIIESMAPNSIPNILEGSAKNSVIAENAKQSEQISDEEEFIEVDDEISNKPQSAEELATLKPKKITLEKKEKDISKKGRNDMNRLLDQYDDVDEN